MRGYISNCDLTVKNIELQANSNYFNNGALISNFSNMLINKNKTKRNN